ncbi:MAG: hypothetical protein OHK005_08300 [Candidatus Methylacidiphilales bacterium]
MIRPVALCLALLAGAVVSLGQTIHVVEQGDTLFGLGRKYGVSVQAIREANAGVTLDTLRIGQRVVIPGKALALSVPRAAEVTTPPPAAPPFGTDRTHRVSAGDTLNRIATRYRVTVSELRQWNGLASDSIRIGQVLRTAPPQASTVSPPPPAPTPTPRPDRKPPGPPPESSNPGMPSVARPPQYLFVAKVERQINAPRVRPGRWRYIVVHHSGTRSGSAKVFEYYHRNVRNMENGMAYHFVIGNGNGSGDGEIEVGDRWRKQLQGGHLASDELNEVAIGICLVGDFNQTRPTRKQIAALVELIDYLSQRTGPRPRFRAHREINPKPTDCPGKFFPVAAMHRLFDTRK